MEEEEAAAAKEAGGGEENLMAVLDFDMLCATVALQTQGVKTEKWAEEDDRDIGGEFGGVQRLWEGTVLDCLADRRIAIESSFCPCYRFGKNMRRANLGYCFLQGSVYLLLAIVILFHFIVFGITKQHCFLYAGVASTIVFGLYMGYYRSRIRKQFNVMGSDSFIDDCMSHIMCPCCSLCQESRTLEMNNVQDGVWHGRGDTICIGSMVLPALLKPSSIPTKSPGLCSMARLSNESSIHSWSSEANHSEPLVP